MLIGGGVGGRYSRPIQGTTCYENRILQNNEHKYFWDDCKFCLSNNIYLIINIDTYLTNSRWKPSNQELRNFVIDTKNRLKSIGANKSNLRFTVDNESDEYCDFGYYMNMVRVIHDALNNEFDLGAGNFRTQKLDWYEHLAEQYVGGYYDVFDFHMQDGLNEATDIANYVNHIKLLKDTYKIKRIAVTEGNNFYNVSSLHGHNMLLCQINYAESIGVEAFCFPYVNWMPNAEEDDIGMAYCKNFNKVSPYWDDMLALIKSKKPIEKGNSEMILSSVKLGTTGYLAELVEELLAVLGYNIDKIDGVFSSKDVTELKKFQYDIKDKYPNIDVDGICGRKCYFYLIDKIEDSAVRRRYEFKLDVYASPVR